MKVLNVNFWTVQQDETHILYCTDDKFGIDFQVKVPLRFNSAINFEELKTGKLTLPEEYSIKIAS